MEIAFPYPGYERIAVVEVRDANLMGVYAPRALGEVDEDGVLARGFAEPHGTPRLREMVRRGDRILILVEDGTRGTPNPEGIADNHPNVLKIGYRPYAEIVRMVEAGEVEDVVGAAVLADVAQVVDRTDCIMVSPGVTREETERLGFRYAVTAQEALEMAFEQQGREAKVAVLRHGGHILPLIESEAAEDTH